MRARHFLRPAAWLFALPAVALPAAALFGDDRDAKREQLDRTLGSLATWRDVERRLDAQAPRGDASRQAIAEAMRLSENAPANPEQAETTIEELRLRVMQLQDILDERAAALATGSPGASGSLGAAPLVAPGTVVPASMGVAHSTEGAATSGAETKPAPTKEYVADRKRLGRACWRGGRYAEGVAALEPVAGDPQADYWRARCLEKLARTDEALKLYRHVIEVAPESPEGRAAREDCEFLEWSLARGLAKQP